MKKLSFAVKANMNKPPRVHVQSADKKQPMAHFKQITAMNLMAGIN
ncbi:hypothetical protein [Legionella tunisiensis]|nr:hypothetical protein [Legionella tunisiensis]